MNITNVLIFTVFIIVSLFIVFTGWSVIRYNSNIKKTKGTIVEKILFSETGGNCIVSSDGTAICNYLVKYTENGNEKTTIVGTGSKLDDKTVIDLYIDTENELVSTLPPLLSANTGWFYIALGVFNFAFLAYMVCMRSQESILNNSNRFIPKFMYDALIV